MHFRYLLPLCLLSLPASAQPTPAAKRASAGVQQGTVPKGRPQPVEHHSRSTWHYHSGPKRNALPGDSSKPAPSQHSNKQDADQ